MFGKVLTAGAALVLLAGAAVAETYEVKMLNKGETGNMVFEPAFVAASAGDTINFVAVDKGHNAQSIKGMLPAGVEPFKSKISKDFSLTVKEEGIYGIKCSPHYALGMVALIQVGAATNLEEATAAKHKGKAKAQFEELLEQVQ